MNSSMPEQNNQKETCLKDIKHVRQVYRLHLMYIVIICFIVMVSTLCVMPNYVSDNAFQNFSFASTIVSIVLAVVSIVYSLWSGQKSSNQYLSMAHIESKIDEQLKGFEHIEESFIKKLNPINEQIEQIKDNQTQTRKSVDRMNDLLGNQNPNIQTQGDKKYNVDGNPIYAELSLYIFAQACATKIIVNTDAINEILGKYWTGYMVALSRSIPALLGYDIVSGGVGIKSYDSSSFGTASEIRERLLRKKEDTRAIIDRIDKVLGIENTVSADIENSTGL